MATTTVKPTDFRVIINPLSEKQSQGKWDFRVVVTRLTDGTTKAELVSGGHIIAESVANRLARDLGMSDSERL